jgi:hypothetical protein
VTAGRLPAVPPVGAALLALALLSGCGYTAGPLSTGGAETIAVAVFDNDTFRREIEVELTQAVVDEVHARTALRLVDDAAGADLVVRGVIRSFTQRVLADRGPDDVTEAAILVTVDVTVENRVRGTETPLTFQIREPFSTTKGQTLASARAEAFENLAEQIVYALEEDGLGRPAESS